MKDQTPKKYECVANDHGYEHLLTEGKIYDGTKEEGIFSNNPYLAVYGDNHKIVVAHLSRFKEVQE